MQILVLLSKVSMIIKHLSNVNFFYWGYFILPGRGEGEGANNFDRGTKQYVRAFDSLRVLSKLRLK